MTSGSLYLVGMAFALFFAALLVAKPRRRLADRILSGWLLVIAAHLLDHYATRVGIKARHPHLLGLGDGLAFLYGPCLLLYVQSQLRPERRLRWRDAFHALPFIGYTLMYVPFFMSPGSGKAALFKAGVTSVPYLFPLALAAKILSLPIYLVFVFGAIRQYATKAEQYYAGPESTSLRWLYYVSAGMAIFWLVIIGSLGAESIWGLTLPGGRADGVIFAAVVVGVITLGYFGFRQGTVFDFAPEAEPESDLVRKPEPAGTAGDVTRYRRSGLTEEVARGHLARLRDLMEGEKLYLDPGLSIEEVAERMGMSRHHLTQVLNEYSGMNFYMFVNEYRVGEACRRMADPGHQHHTVLAIGLESGFNSKSAFNAAFKRLTSMTPSEFREARAGRS